MINDKVDPFINQYRDALERQRDISNQYNDNQRRNDFASIMSGANNAGMLYSNFPERSKIQYDTQTYMPNQVKVRETYRTGLDKLRTNTLNLHNQLASINEAIADLNKTNGGGGGSGDLPGVKTWDYGNGYSIKGKNGGEATYYKNGKQISAGQFLEGIGSNSNWKNWTNIWDSGVKTDGVGVDTISAYGKGGINQSTNGYGYLYK